MSEPAPAITADMRAWFDAKVGDDPSKAPPLNRPWKVRDIAAYLGITVASARTYRNQNRLPEPFSGPDDPLGVCWWPATIIGWDMTRPTQGWSRGQTRRKAADRP